MVSLGQVALYGIAGFTAANLVEADGGSKVALNPWAGDVARAGRSGGRRPPPRSDREQELRNLLPHDHARLLGAGLPLLRASDAALRVRWRQQRRPALGRREPAAAAGAPLLHRAGGLRRRLRCDCATSPGHRSVSPSRECATTRRGCGRSATTSRSCARLPLLLARSSQGSPESSPSGGIRGFRLAPFRLPQTIDLLVIAVIGGLYRLEGAWVGAVVVTVLDNWLRGVDLVGNRFNTVIGAVFLAIVLISPGGLMGIWDSAYEHAPVPLRTR